MRSATGPTFFLLMPLSLTLPTVLQYGARHLQNLEPLFPERPGSAFLVLQNLTFLQTLGFGRAFFFSHKGPFSKHQWEDEFRSRIAEQRAKTLLLEVPVIGKRFAKPSRRIVCIEMQSTRL